MSDSASSTSEYVIDYASLHSALVSEISTHVPKKRVSKSAGGVAKREGPVSEVVYGKIEGDFMHDHEGKGKVESDDDADVTSVLPTAGDLLVSFAMIRELVQKLEPKGSTQVSLDVIILHCKQTILYTYLTTKGSEVIDSYGR